MILHQLSMQVTLADTFSLRLMAEGVGNLTDNIDITVKDCKDSLTACSGPSEQLLIGGYSSMIKDITAGMVTD